MPRVILFSVLAAIILVGPVYGHFFATGDMAYVGWKMFSRKATDFCAVEYVRVGPDGARRPLDRFAVLKAPPDRRAGRLWRIRDLKAAHHEGRRLCKALGPEADVRVAVRCATKTGWKDMGDPDERLCRRGRR